MRIGMAMHIMFNSVKKVWRDFDADMLYFVQRVEVGVRIFMHYKANRKVLADKRSTRTRRRRNVF